MNKLYTIASPTRFAWFTPLLAVVIFLGGGLTQSFGQSYTFIKTLQQSPRIDLYSGNITATNGFFSLSNGSKAFSTTNWDFPAGTSFGTSTVTDKPVDNCSFTFTSSSGVYAVAVKGGNYIRVYYFDTPQFSVTLSSVLKSDVTPGVSGCWGISHAVFHQAPCSADFTVASTNVSCHGAADGSITVSPNAFTSASVKDASGNLLSGNGNIFSNLSPGTYTITGTSTVSSENGCFVQKSVTISEPSKLTASVSGSNLNCNGDASGAADLTVSGGTAPYSYSWSNGATVQDLSGIAAGTYSVNVKDANGCEVSASVTITEPSVLSASISGTDLKCNNDGSGAADLSVSGGTAPYTYSWSNGATSQDLSGIAAGTYSVTVTDANGCAASASVIISEPAVLSASVSGTNLKCNSDGSGAADLSVSGGTAPYSISWSNGSSSEDLSGLQAGIFSVKVTDANGCEASASVTITEPALLTALADGKDLTCNGDASGAADLTVSGGTAPYSYSWSNGATVQDLSGIAAGTYSVNVTDANGCEVSASITISEPAVLSASISGTDLKCNDDDSGAADLSVSGGTAPYTYSWSSGATSQDLSGIAAGTYSVIVTDANGCEVSASVTISEPAVLTASVSGTDLKCNNDGSGAADLSVSGGTAPYSFVWSNNSTSEDLSGIAAGTYSVTVTDANGCQIAKSVTIDEPSVLSASVSGTNLNCNGDASGAADLSVSGGTAPYSYAWSNNSTSEDLSGIAAGTYSVTITDANGCQISKSVTLTEPSALSASVAGTNLKCNSDGSGAADLSVSGGTAPYSYFWSNSATSEDLSGIAAGTYSVTVTDANGCQISKSVTITQPAVLSASVSGMNLKCNSDGSGAADLSVSGGTSPYSYVWNNGATIQDLSGLSAGSYSVNITDANGCTASASVSISEPAVLSASVSGTNLTCNGVSTGVADLSVSGGTTPYNYAWSNGSTSQDLSNLAAGTYSVVVTDKNGCKVSASVTLTQPAGISVTATPSWPICESVDAGGQVVASVSAPAGFNILSYSWTKDGQPFAASTATISGLAAGSYQVTVTYNDGCKAAAPAAVVRKTCGQVFYSYTQGYYGNTRGMGCAFGNSAMRSADLVANAMNGVAAVSFGGNGRTFTLRNTDLSANLYVLLPGGGTPRAFAVGTYDVVFSSLKTNYSKIPLNSKGNIDNNLLSQAIALYFNIRNNPGNTSANGNLGALVLKSTGMITAKGPSCGSQVISAGTAQTFNIPQPVLTRLADYPGGATISNLLQLANDLMGGVATGISAADVNAAVDAINRGFDQGRILVGWAGSSGRSIDSLTPSVEPDQVIDAIDVKVNTYPNPYVDRVNIMFEVPRDTRATVEVISLSGSKVSTLFDGEVKANTEYYTEFSEKPAAGSMYIYRIVTPDGVKVGKLYYMQTNR